MVVIPPLLQVSCRDIFVSRIIVNDWDGAMGSGEVVVVMFIVLGVSKIYL